MICVATNLLINIFPGIIELEMFLQSGNITDVMRQSSDGSSSQNKRIWRSFDLAAFAGILFGMARLVRSNWSTACLLVSTESWLLNGNAKWNTRTQEIIPKLTLNLEPNYSRGESEVVNERRGTNHMLPVSISSRSWRLRAKRQNESLFSKITQLALAAIHKAAGQVNQWNSEKVVSKPHCAVLFVS